MSNLTKIAVVVNEAGMSTSLTQSATIKIYQKQETTWDVIGEQLYDVSLVKTPMDIRRSLKEMGTWLDDCKTIILSELNGIYFTLLEGMYFEIWEMQGDPVDHLDYIYQSQVQERQTRKIEKKPVEPEEIRPGHYYINLCELMRDKNALTSKQVLLPFFNKQPFKSLIIDCDHMPRWFDKEFESMGLKAETSQFRDGMKVTVKPV